MEKLFHCRISNQIRESPRYEGALECTGARLAGLVLTAKARNFLLRPVMKGAFWMSIALLGLVCGSALFALISKMEMEKILVSSKVSKNQSIVCDCDVVFSLVTELLTLLQRMGKRQLSYI